MFKKILVPVDRSALAPTELKTALAMAGRFEAQVTVLRILPEAASLKAGETEVDLNVVEHETKELLAEALAQLDVGMSAEHVHAEVRSGPVVSTILGAAEEGHTDLIVVGSHGRHRAIEWLTGSTAEQLVAKAAASVLVIKPAGFPFLRE